MILIFRKEGGNDIQHGIEYACLKCRYEFFVDTYFEYEEHEWAKMWSEHIGNEFVFDCLNSDCPRQLILTYEVQ